jgi:uncharacterized protein YggU (UPF0235/DUF167 family)
MISAAKPQNSQNGDEAMSSISKYPDKYRLMMKSTGKLAVEVIKAPDEGFGGRNEEGELEVLLKTEPTAPETNAALIAFIAKSFGIREHLFSVTAGDTSNHKLITYDRGNDI